MRVNETRAHRCRPTHSPFGAAAPHNSAIVPPSAVRLARVMKLAASDKQEGDEFGKLKRLCVARNMPQV